MNTRLVRALAVLLVLAAPAAAQPLSTAFTYQGEVDQSGSPVSGRVDLRFRLYDAPSAGTQLGSTLCAAGVQLAAGRFTITLDFGQQFVGQQRFLELDVRPTTGLDCSTTMGFTTLAPRQPLTAAPYAAYALNAGSATSAAQLNGQPASFYTNAANLTGTLPSASLSGSYSGPVNLTNASNTFFGNGAGLTSLNASNLGSGTIPAARFPIPLLLSAPLDGIAVLSATNSGSASSTSAISALATSTTGITYALFAQDSSASGIGAFGWASSTSGNTTGVYGQSNSTSGAGVQGYATANSGATFGMEATCASSSGKGIFAWAIANSGNTFGGHFRSSSTSGVGVLGEALATSGTTYGGKFTAASVDGFALYAENTSTASGSITARFNNDAPSSSAALYAHAGPTTNNAGAILADTNAPSGTALSGYAQATTGPNFGVTGVTYSTSGTGVWGAAIANSGNTYGVYGIANSGWSVYAANQLGAGGTKSFRIDHPADPTQRYLLHYCTEGPEVTNFYSGKITLDQDGRATVTLPAYFAAINADPRYTLTAIGSPMPGLHIAREIDDAALAAGAAANPGDPIPECSFVIAGGAPGGKVSWRLEALRNDRWVRQHGAPVETEKTGEERGTYQHPELFGQPASAGMPQNQPKPPPPQGSHL